MYGSAAKSVSIGLTFFVFIFVLATFVFSTSNLASNASYGSWLSPASFLCDVSSNEATDTRLKRAKLQPFRNRPELEDMGEVGDRLWSQISSTSQGGFIWVRHNETYKTGYGVSMFHALHCLSMVRDALKGPGRAMSDHMSHSRAESRGSNAEHEMHTSHCLSYIAQSLLCSADGTLEQPRTLKDDAGNVIRDDVTGEDIVHQCKGADFLRESIEATERSALTSTPDLKAGATIWDVFK